MSPRLRIVHCFRNPVGGLFRHVRDLAAEQATAGHAVGIIADSTTGGPYEDALFAALSPSLELGVTRIPMRRAIAPGDAVAAARVLRHLRRLQPDVIHGHGAKGGAYARLMGTALRLAGGRPARIYTPHGGSLHYDAASIKGRLYFTAEHWLERMSDALVFVSRYEADTYGAKVGVPRRPVTIALNGLRPAEFEPVAIGEEPRDLLFIGMLRDLKGPDVFISALARIRDRTGAAPTAHIVGSGDDKARYVEMVASLGLDRAVSFHQPMPAREAFALARVVVVPSRAESMPYLVLEALAAGKPTLATRVGGIPEIFGAASDALVPPGDADALSNAIAATLAELPSATARAERLRQAIRGTFSIKAMAASVEAAYRDALAAAAPSGSVAITDARP
ncbi:MAG: glycosyltransferase family 4 protein [Bauldia sp.]